MSKLICATDGCDKPSVFRRYCATCYTIRESARPANGGEPTIPTRPIRALTENLRMGDPPPTYNKGEPSLDLICASCGAPLYWPKSGNHARCVDETCNLYGVSPQPKPRDN